ncbi:Crp/Fnr family transcriptional regulator [Hymenobacter crusticola]|uniref:Cyclic nucleotide-binding protein n=1 Tax=Hymenobacter crusticola TaxID=1770526 RepID=A0A243WBB6_9BACT|nr:Crp/Fnr family transcriptional regulator [Hymenobacter crusticola]OUJ72895.1 cyclic nucleotide-binding protein [Hymenobacter crusticola]
MDELFTYLLQFGSLNQQQLDLIASKTTTLLLPKDAYFLEAGHVARHVGFLLEGVMRICYYNNKGDEITRNFVDEQHLVADLRGLEYSLPSPEYVQAVTDCRLLLFSKRDWDDLAHTIVGWSEMVHKMTAKHLREKLARISPMVAQDATTRYQEFIENYPRMANRIPLSYLASFLGITQSSLSRIRKNIR